MIKTGTLKNFLMRILYFFLSNLVGVGITFVFVLVIFFFNRDPGGNLQVTKTIQLISNVVATLLTSGVFPIAFYKLYFLKNTDFERFFKNDVKQSRDINQAVQKHLKHYGKQDLVWLLFFTALSTLLPSIYQSGVGLLLATYCLFVYIPIPVLPAILWAVYIGAVYVVCLRLACKRWSNELKEMNII